MAVIYCFGDSITYGAWDIESSGWANRLRKHLDDLQLKDSSLYYLSYNLGIPGDTTDGLVERFDTEFSARMEDEEEMIFVFAFGANDAVFSPKNGTFKVPKVRFVANMQSVLDKAKKSSKKTILLNITPADEEICTKRYEGKDKLRLNKNYEEYNALIADLAKTNALSLVDVYSAYGTDFKQFLSEDGLHPNEKGHQLVFDLVRKEIFKEK